MKIWTSVKIGKMTIQCPFLIFVFDRVFSNDTFYKIKYIKGKKINSKIRGRKILQNFSYTQLYTIYL